MPDTYILTYLILWQSSKVGVISTSTNDDCGVQRDQVSRAKHSLINSMNSGAKIQVQAPNQCVVTLPCFYRI